MLIVSKYTVYKNKKYIIFLTKFADQKFDMEYFGLDNREQAMMDFYRENYNVFEKIESILKDALNKAIEKKGINIIALESRIKTEKSLAGKLSIKGSKYHSILDITDIVGARIITFFNDEVDTISALVDKTFVIDWQNSVDKRKMHELDSFGYNSLHFICSIPKSLYYDPECPLINEIRFELQMRTALQHVWANMYHDTGYKSGIEVPPEYLRSLNRLAGMLELADEQFSNIRSNISNYRHRVKALVRDGKLDDVLLDGDSFHSFLEQKPFDKLNDRIARINQAEIVPASPVPYLKIFKDFRFRTLGELSRFIGENSEDAFQLALYQLANTDMDIISSTIGVQNLCIVHILKCGMGVDGLKRMFDILGGVNDYNQERAERVMKAASKLAFLNR